MEIKASIQEIWCRQAISQHSKTHVTLKIWSRKPKSNHFLPIFQQYICASLVEIQPSLRKYGADKPFINIRRPCMTLKKGSRSPKSNQCLSMSQQCICASLIKIHSFLLQGADKPFSNIIRPCVTLKMGSMSPNLISFFLPPNDVFV